MNLNLNPNLNPNPREARLGSYLRDSPTRRQEGRRGRPVKTEEAEKPGWGPLMDNPI